MHLVAKRRHFNFQEYGKHNYHCDLKQFFPVADPFVFEKQPQTFISLVM